MAQPFCWHNATKNSAFLRQSLVCYSWRLNNEPDKWTSRFRRSHPAPCAQRSLWGDPAEQEQRNGCSKHIDSITWMPPPPPPPPLPCPNAHTDQLQFARRQSSKIQPHLHFWAAPCWLLGLDVEHLKLIAGNTFPHTPTRRYLLASVPNLEAPPLFLSWHPKEIKSVVE